MIDTTKQYLSAQRSYDNRSDDFDDDYECPECGEELIIDSRGNVECSECDFSQSNSDE